MKHKKAYTKKQKNMKGKGIVSDVYGWVAKTVTGEAPK
jgi:hypothetical protein